MRVSSRSDYGVRALFDLAERYGRGPIQSREIAMRQGIPEAYLHQLLGALNRAGLVRSTRGPLGGHELAREPLAISIWDILVALDGPDRHTHPHPHNAADRRDVVHGLWHELQTLSEEFLKSVNLATLLDRARGEIADYVI